MSDKKIFIADDDAATVASLKALLEHAGFRVESTAVATEIVQKIKAFNPHLILLDLVMPELDGFTVCSLLQSNKTTQDIPILAISGLSDYADMERAYSAGAVGYITKPYDFPKLLKDINRIIAHKEALHEERNFITAILDTAAALIVVLDAKGQIMRWNSACEQISGFGLEEVRGTYIWESLAAEEEKRSVKAHYATLSPQTRFLKTEYSWITKNCQRRAISWADAVLLDSDSSIQYIVSTGIDITDRKNAEEKLQQAYNELKQAQVQLMQSTKMAAVGRIANWVAHEIKNPLAIVLQGSEYLKSSVASMPDLLSPTEKVMNAALRADRIVKDLLNFSRQTQVVFEIMDIAPVIEESLSLVEHQLGLRNIAIKKSFGLGLPKVKIDPNLIKQVCINILVNAVEAMREKGSIAIGLRYDKDGSPARPLEIVFSDTGPGIEEENINKVFEPFFSTKKKEGSAGLGLSITQEIVERHGGKIMIKSKPGEGTNVIIQLPIA